MQGLFLCGYPNEVVVVAYSDGRVRELANLDPEPRDRFSLSDPDRLALVDDWHKGRVLALIHSHPDRTNTPSDHDYQSQMATGMTWGIVQVQGDGDSQVYEILEPVFWGDAVDRGELEGREYQWGINDCFTLLRDFYRSEYGLLLPDAPRYKNALLYPSDHPAHDVITEWLRTSPFEWVPASERQRGDAYAIGIQSAVANHCGVYMGEGKYLDALEGRVSAIRTLGAAEAAYLKRAQFYRLKGAHDPGKAIRPT